MLVDVGQGIVESIQKGISELGFNNSSSSSSPIIPDAVLITHSHDDHIRELPLLADKATDKSKRLNIYSTSNLIRSPLPYSAVILRKDILFLYG
jgi:Cft2 family RNA processing exonuclease